MGGFVGVDYTVPGVGLSYDGSGTKYSGLDAFNRVIDLRWKTSSTNKVQAKYGYSRASNRTFRMDQQAHDDGKITQDQMFWYDGLYQVIQAQRGDLTPGTGPPYTGIDPTTRQQSEIFGYDQMGNWLSYNVQSPSLTQTRSHNKANEITSITPTNVIQPAFDAMGNMTQMPQPASWTQKLTAKWDAWNRLIQVKDNSGSTLATYAYDGLFRRVTKIVSGSTRKFYHTDSWQVAEEYVGSATDPGRRYFWGLRNINDLIRRQRYSSGTTLQDDLYALADAMNVVALIEKVAGSPVVQQRIGYDAFGTPFWMDGSWNGSSNGMDWSATFHGHYLDTESGLYQMRFRYYNAKLGRWLSRDMIAEQGGLNLYGFVRNNPLSKTDRHGLHCRDCWTAYDDCVELAREIRDGTLKSTRETYDRLQQAVDELSQRCVERCEDFYDPWDPTGLGKAFCIAGCSEMWTIRSHSIIIARAASIATIEIMYLVDLKNCSDEFNDCLSDWGEDSYGCPCVSDYRGHIA
jgi:RHS repeat-associated protein